MSTELSATPHVGRRRRLRRARILSLAHLDGWVRFLFANRFAVESPYLPRLLWCLGFSTLSSLLFWPERLLFSIWRDPRPIPPPVFVVGYFRSGTTLLHNLLSRDPRLGFPTNAQIMNPHGFVTARILFRPIIWMIYGGKMPRWRRPSDNVIVSLDDPQEEEFATANLGAPSVYYRGVFPRHAAFYNRFITFDDATPREREQWGQSLTRFLRKVMLFNRRRRLILKSPYNTARVRHLIRLFPGAQFVHIHRHPFDVVRSDIHRRHSTAGGAALQDSPPIDDIERAVATEYAEVEAAFYHNSALLKPGQWTEVAYEDLERDKVGECRRIYRELGLEFHPEYERRLVAYVESLAGYRKNTLRPLPPDTHRKLVPILQPMLERWGYPVPEPAPAGTAQIASEPRAGEPESARLAIRTAELTRRFGVLIAVDAVSIEVRPGEIFGLVGPNGAGKTTTIKMLTTLLPPTSGGMWVAGCDVSRQPAQVRRRIGYVPQMLSADGALTGEENLRLSAGLYGVPRAEWGARIRAALALMGLQDAADTLVRHYSGGMIRRLEIAQSMLHRPAVLFMDEPTIGLDPAARRAIWDHIQGLRQEFGTTVLITTHYMDEAERFCDRVAVMHRGGIVAVGTPDELKTRVGPGVSLDDVFIHLTGATLDTDRDSEGGIREVRRTRRTARRLS